jgi:hypothetical protein
MAQLSINQCQNCGKILAPGVTKCGKCHTEHSVIPTVVNPLRFSAAEAAEYRSQFEEQVKEFPKDSNALFAMGLTYLGLKNYELADEYFRKAVALTPSNPDVYYYTALSLFHHRSVMNLSKMEMDRIEQWLDTAVKIQPKRKYLILQMILRQGMSSMGLNVDTDKLSPAELLQQAKITVQEEDELYEIEQHVLVTDEKTRALVNSLVNGDKAGNTSIFPETMNAYLNFCDYARENDGEWSTENVKKLCDEDARRAFFKVLHEPQVPQKLPKPSLIAPFFKSLWKGALAIFSVIVIIIIVQGFLKWGGDKTIKGETPQARLEAFQSMAEGRKVYVARYRDEAGKEMAVRGPFNDEKVLSLPDATKYSWKVPGFKGNLGKILIILPLILWALFTIKRFYVCARERRDVGKRNQADREQYEREHAAYLDRPSIEDYKLFCSLFAGPNNNGYIVDEGDFVEAALQQAHIAEEDIKNGNGKIFFSCYLLDTDNNNNDCRDPEITLRQMAVRVCVAMRDSIVFLHGIWETESNVMPILDQERLLYSQIANFRNVQSYSTLDLVSHSNSVLAEIIYGYGDFPSLFRYQGVNPSDDLTYSTTRTSDFDEFYNSLVKMHTAYVKS